MLFKFYLPFLMVCVLALSAFDNGSVNGGALLKAGEKAPMFVSKDIVGNKVSLKKMLKESNVLLTFFRPAWCPVCNARTHELIKSYKDLKAQGIEVIAIYPSTAEVLQGYAKDIDIPFTVIADPKEELYRLYGVERSKEKYALALKEKKVLKASKEGTMLYKKYGNDYGGLRAVEKPIIPADFVLKKGTLEVKTAYYGAYLGDHIDISELLQPTETTKNSNARF